MIRRIILTMLFSTILFSGIALSDNSFFASASHISFVSDTSSNEWSIAWNHTYTSSNLAEADSVIQTADGGFLLAGKTYLNAGTNIGDKMALLKVDSLGNTLWEKTYDAVGNPLSKWLIATNDNGYALVGQQNGGFCLAKIDDKGNLQWNQTYNGEGFSWAVSLTQTNDGGYALTGQTGVPIGKTSLSSDEAGGVIWIVKTDSSGNKEWGKTLGDGMVSSIVQTSDGGYALAANKLSDYYLIKTSSAGDLMWNKTYRSEDNDAVYSVVQTTDGGYALGGWLWLRSNGGGANFGIVKTDASGNKQWTQFYGEGFARCMIQTSDEGFAIGGNKLVKVGSDGNEQWQVGLGANLTCQAYSVTETQDGSYGVAGAFVDEGGTSSAFLAKISSSATSTPTVAPIASNTDKYILASAIAIVVVLIIIGAILMMVRKRP